MATNSLERKKAITKQLLGREPLKGWYVFCEDLKVEVSNLLRLGTEKGNSRMKFLGRTSEQVAKGKTNTNLKDLTSISRAIKTELKQEHLVICEKQEKVIERVWKLISKNAQLSELGDPFIAERIKYLSSLIAAYQAGDICFNYQKLVKEHNAKIVELNQSYGYVAVKKVKATKSAPVPTGVVAEELAEA